MIVIFDLDGTLALNGHRQHFLQETPANWMAFYDACDDDLPNKPVIEIARFFARPFHSFHTPKYKIVILTGRENRTDLNMEERTRKWLNKYQIPFDRLLMREEGDYRSDYEVKEEIFKNNFLPEEIFCVFDDRDSVVRMWRQIGLTCFQVAEGDF